MTIDNIYEPNNEDVLDWISDKSDNWPTTDWDYYVMNGKNDELVFKLANEKPYFKKGFFVHSLYYLVGDYFNGKKENTEKRNRINKLIDMVNLNSSNEVKQWRDKTLKLLSHELSFNPYFWLNYMFYQPE